MELGAKYILAVYRNKGFSAAARELGIAQPSLSATVAKFEKELGFKVFNRGTNPLSLTDEGRIYIDHLKEVVDSEQNMLYRIAHRAPSFTSALRIGVSATSYACQQLAIKATAIFNGLHPQVPIQLHMGLQMKSDELYRMIRRKNIDILITEKLKSDSEFNAIHLADDYMVFAARKDLPQVSAILPYSVSRKEAVMADGSGYMTDASILNDLPFISAGGEGYTAKKLFETVGDGYTLSKISLNNHYHMHYQLMQDGVGAAITSSKQLLNPFFNNDDIVYFLPKTEAPYQKNYLIRLCSKTPHKHEDEFIDILRDVAKNTSEYV